MKDSNCELTIIKLAIIVVFSLFFSTCSSLGRDTETAIINKHSDNRPPIPFVVRTKAQIDAYIDENWKDYGYSERPVKFAAITFDDGPAPADLYGGSQAMVDLLNVLKIKATFYVNGNHLRDDYSQAEVIFDAGHEFGNHSDTHQNLGELRARWGEDAVRKQILDCSNETRKVAGAYPRTLRAPFLNSQNQPWLLNLIANLDDDEHGNAGMVVIGVSLDSNDWKKEIESGETSSGISLKALINNVTRPDRMIDGVILLFHETRTSQNRTLTALPEIVQIYRNAGFWFLTVSEMFSVRGREMVPGTFHQMIGP